jgi:hypothetical protein
MFPEERRIERQAKYEHHDPKDLYESAVDGVHETNYKYFKMRSNSEDMVKKSEQLTFKKN